MQLTAPLPPEVGEASRRQRRKKTRQPKSCRSRISASKPDKSVLAESGKG